MKRANERTVSIILCLVLALSGNHFVHGQATDAEEQLEGLIVSFLNEYNLNEHNFSFSYYNTVTGEEYGFNEQKMMQAASLYKLPLNMYYYEQEALGSISPDAKFAGYALSQCHMLSLQYSDNATSQAMRRALGKYSAFKTAIDIYTGVSAEELGGSYLNENYFSSFTIMNTLKYLYEHSEFFAEAIGYLKEAHPERYFKKFVEDYEIAQKYGWLENNVNTAGIVYTPSPYLLCVFTENVNSAEKVIGSLNKLLCDYTVNRHNEYLAKREAVIAATRLVLYAPPEIRLGADFNITARVSGVDAEYQAVGAYFTVDGEIVKTFGESIVANGIEFTLSRYFAEYNRESVEFRFRLTVYDGTELESSVIVPVSPKPPSRYRDIDGHWAESAIEELTSKGIFQGDGSGYFYPYSAMSRAMFVAALYRVAANSGIDAVPGSVSPFVDVDPGIWYGDCVTWAYNNGIVNGSGSHFYGNDAISREQAVTMLARLIGVVDSQRLSDIDTGEGRSDIGSAGILRIAIGLAVEYLNTSAIENVMDDSGVIDFSDSDEIDDWAYDAVMKCAETGLITGYDDGCFRPSGILTRAEAAAMLDRLNDIYM